MKKNKYPFIIPSSGVTYFKKYREHFDKCLNVFLSDKKQKAKGKVLNVAMPQYGRNGKKGIIVTVEYITLDNSVKTGEYYMDYPNNYPGINDQIDIYYIDDDYSFVYIDEKQFLNKSLFIDSNDKAKNLFNEIKLPITMIFFGIILSLVSIITLNKYLLLLSTISLLVLVIISYKKSQNPVLLLFIVPFLIGFIGLLKYSFDNLSNFDYIVCLNFALNFLYIIALFIYSRIVKKENKK